MTSEGKEEMITKRKILREKVNNMCSYIDSLFPKKDIEIKKLKSKSDEEIITWILTYISPKQNDLDVLLLDILKWCFIERSEIKQIELLKLRKYLEFFVEITQG
jgi:hypothetical protein